MTYLQAIIIAIVEGITEFLPVSSTGHMIVTTSLMGIGTEEFTKLFIVVIQLGAILAVVVNYRRQFINLKDIGFYLKLLAGFIPIVIFGLLFKKNVDQLLERVDVVGWSLLIGGFFLLFIDRIFSAVRIHERSKISYLDAFIVGIFQCIALVPGVSRAAATITGGLFRKFSRTVAAEFSFFLAVPTMFAATVKDLWDFKKAGLHLGMNEIKFLALGNLVAFIVALVVLRYAIQFLVRYGFRYFGIYRILAGAAILAMIHYGVSLQLLK
jgi:undecaprenyl-diphosphatase